MQFNYGFTYKGIPYGWHKRTLYRLPFSRDMRWYSMKELDEIAVGNNRGYRCAKDKLSFEQLKYLTKEIDIKIEQFKNADTPF